MSDALDSLTRDQEDFYARLSADPLFSDVKVLEQRKGVVESDIEVALATLNEKSGKLGAVAIVIMPDLVPSEKATAVPEYRVRAAVQVIAQAILNDGEDGTGKTAEILARRVRQLFHNFSGGHGGTFTFAGMEPIQRSPSEASYVATFTRLARDGDYPRLGQPLITPDEGAAPQNVTLTAADGAAIYYTLDGSYPWSGNDEATLYSAPVAVATAATLRAVAYKDGYQSSDVASADFT